MEEAAADAMGQSGFVYDHRTGLYYDWNSGYYYDPVSLLEPFFLSGLKIPTVDSTTEQSNESLEKSVLG